MRIEALLLAFLIAVPHAGVPAAATQSGGPAPPFTHTAPRDWINSPPLEMADLRGQVVLVDFWAFMCWNCYRSFPWLNDLEKRLDDEPFRVIGVHAPEFDAERNRESVRAKARAFGLTHPIMIDNDHSYWRAMNNRFWPTYYLIGKQGRVRDRFIGETHVGDPQARRIEARIRELLAE